MDQPRRRRVVARDGSSGYYAVPGDCRMHIAVDRHGSSDRTELTAGMADWRPHHVCTLVGMRRLPLLAISRCLRHIHVECSRIRSICGVHHRLDVLDRHTLVPADRALFYRGQLAAVVADEYDEAGTPTYFICFSLIVMGICTILNVRGLSVAKWLNSAGAVARWLGTLLLVVLALASWWSFRAGNGHQSAHDRTCIPAQRCHFLDDTRFRLDRARSRVIHGSGESVTRAALLQRP